jgi:amino acid adenylation domain-containing protein
MNVVSLIARLAEQDIRLRLEDGNLRYSAPDGAMTPEIVSQLRNAKSELVEFLQQSEHSAVIQLPVANRNEPLAISYAQQRLWFIHQLDATNTAYHIHVTLLIKGMLNLEFLTRACNEIVRRHEILHTHYEQQGGKVVQVISAPQPFTINLETLPAGQLPDAIHHELHQPFNLAGQIFRIRLWQIADEEYALSFTIHHIAADGWSLGIFVNELVQLYKSYSENKPSPLPALERQYVDFALWQAQNLAQQDQQLLYWQKQLEGVPNLSLPYDAPPSTYISNDGGFVDCFINSIDTQKLHALNKAQGTTMFMTLLGTLSVLLHRYSQQSDFCVGTPIAGRSNSQLESIIGCFINVLAVRCKPLAKQTFSEYLQTVKASCSEAFNHQEMPFERIVQEVVAERDLAINPLFQVMLSVQNTPFTTIDDLHGLQISAFKDTEAAAQIDLKLTAQEVNGVIDLRFEYKKALFKQETIERFAEHFLTLTRAVTSQPQLQLHNIPLFEPAQQKALLGLQEGGWNATARALPDTNIVTLFEQQAERTPDAKAVSSPAGTLTYAQFNARVNQLTHYLIEAKHLHPQSRVVICLPADIDFLVAVYAVVKAGACYIPIDPNYPDDRIHHIIQDARAELVISDHAQRERLQLDHALCLCLAELRSALDDYSDGNPGVYILPEQAIYGIYTSGSTGLPKGVEVKHRGENNLIHWYNNEFGFNRMDKCLIVSAAGFDLTQKNFFAPLCSGGEVVFHGLELYDPVAIRQLVADKGITVINCAPSALYPLLQPVSSYPQLQTLRVVLLGGEPIRIDTVKPWLDATAYRCELVNMYGPTECTDIASIYRIRNAADLAANDIPIGKPIANTQLHILDSFQQLMPFGAVGELYIGGAGLAKGYINNTALSTQSFIDNPFSGQGHPSHKLYKTGDLVRYEADGNINYVGRTDHQVKIRGLRIELGEIENRLQKVPGIKESVVVALTRDGNKENQHLVAYYLATDVPVSTATIRHQLLLELPQYMIPAYFIALEAWPLSANGKIDRKALPQPDWSQLNRRPYAAPENPTQIALAAIWSEVLGVEKIGIHDSFLNWAGIH